MKFATNFIKLQNLFFNNENIYEIKEKTFFKVLNVDVDNIMRSQLGVLSKTFNVKKFFYAVRSFRHQKFFFLTKIRDELPNFAGNRNLLRNVYKVVLTLTIKYNHFEENYLIFTYLLST